ncbi:NADPH-dependent 7-cyano-7-deazaguanine reductase QueF [Pseudidiomarina terrestris]|uniref:NADPH-dependent 7-cyano-7-deazaguanine reductase n=1 Tax=Pseudidiomarina terrestris TaxID=2820060 RepID=A0AAW7QXH3_9GAMM|nr:MULTISPECIES: NADPH-dependent 7-cyano-7-deazaguanine reductase QueF [unclassified Pseudidiomarina]MDN7123540.1 NADPH-dependent 7-cyano-7-deazaguanine reductase QueF [Pseudidiomarina sp. 1APP75-32.1]MDN7128736.1 NADPH-dependent 7-cyano-7-deazaguanine reductase QueF [Pseudidiomarina sp. 1APR75-15]MDN7135005.1 NADPH-dependent 7-cyano-7-deazaguanine reductase QueF [Pseudidiomarina sp. 1ASP75-5]MEA3587216.1 NADPH-dependent 7-cyano-7-deazaguanine reductase QueF [Pseudidiomarina sp. 1APP75-27a]
MKQPPAEHPLAHLNLGQATQYPEHYDAGLLQAVPRQLNRTPIGISADAALPFHGQDYWTGYEISWLLPNGLPQVAIGYFIVPCTSPNLVESKSFKLYLNSFNASPWQSRAEVEARMHRDLSDCAGAPVQVKLVPLEDAQHAVGTWQAESIDSATVAITSYDYQPELLQHGGDQRVTEQLSTHLLKSNCLITNQPDWGSLYIHYQGRVIDRSALLRYIVSFRNHNEFHEQCVERIFMDLTQRLDIEKLTVYARYTRRGGLDINPFRSNFETAPTLTRLSRQ